MRQGGAQRGKGRAAQALPRGKVRRIGGLVARAGGRAFARRGFREAKLLTEWAAIVGPDFAARCVPEKLRRDGTLVLRADGPTALQLQHVEPQLRERIAVFAGYEAVKRLVCRQQPLPPPPAVRREPAPARDAPAGARAALATVADDALRKALERLGRRVAAANRPALAPQGRTGDSAEPAVPVPPGDLNPSPSEP